MRRLHWVLHEFGLVWSWQYFIDKKTPEYNSRKYRKCTVCGRNEERRHTTWDGDFWSEVVSGIPDTAVLCIEGKPLGDGVG